MIVNKHSSFYMRSGWGTKIIDAVNSDVHIFSPINEQKAVDEIGLGRIMIKALRYWSVAMGLTEEGKDSEGIVQQKTDIFKLIAENDRFFHDNGSLLVLHRNLSQNLDEATAWYWFFNEWDMQSITKEEFADAFHSFLTVNNMKIKRDAVEKEFNCLKNTYVGDDKFDLKRIMDEDTYPFLGPLGLLSVSDDKHLVKRSLGAKDIPLELLIYFIALDNAKESTTNQQINIDKLLEEKKQVGKYLNIRYTKLIELLLEAENKHYIALNTNFGNRFIEFLNMDYTKLITKYYTGRED